MKKKTHWITGLLLFLGLVYIVVPWAKVFPNPWLKNLTTELPPLSLEVDSDGLTTKAGVQIETNKGLFKLRFYPDAAPKTVDRFLKLTHSGFYNDLKFHRVVKEPMPFVVEAGDPNGDGTGGTGIKLTAEFSRIQVKEGTVGLARGEDPDTGDSVFFISLGVHPDLDRKYTVFAKVVEGFEVVQKIEANDIILSMKIETY